MNAISIQQPWASAIVMGQRHGHPFATPPRGLAGDGKPVPLLIHAPAKPSPAVNNRWVMRRLERANALLCAQARGALIGTAELVDVVDLASVTEWHRPDLAHWKRHHPGKVLWRLRHPMVFTQPIPWRGAPGLFDVDDAAVADAMIEARIPCDYIAWRNRTQIAARGGGG